MDPQEPVQVVDQNIDFICTIDGANTNAHANARLIAAAPEMLAALEACIPWLAKAIFYDLATMDPPANRKDLSAVLGAVERAARTARGEVSP